MLCSKLDERVKDEKYVNQYTTKRFLFQRVQITGKFLNFQKFVEYAPRPIS